MAMTISFGDKQHKLDEYMKLMHHAESNFSEGHEHRVYIAAGQNRSAADIARSLNEVTLQSVAANRSYDRFMSLAGKAKRDGKDVVLTTEYACGGFVHVYKLYENAALVAEENGLGVEKVSEAARKAVITLIERVDKTPVKPYANYGDQFLRCNSVVDLSEANRITEKFGLSEEVIELKILKEKYTHQAQQQLESLIRTDYKGIREK